ncbi:MAG: hypothetical protein K9N11_05680 [Lentisphaeria bacterium]|nr:hypothetical protein [Candidatus Neomarinimicrobiota bacterium]MCF7842323.1 hypothetical protein [Lentisphaeria bacterium]
MMMGTTLGARRKLQFVLFIMVLHSAVTGLLLITLPGEWFAWFGLNVHPQRFFSCQGGIFHIILAVAYGMGMIHPVKYALMIHFSIFVKFCAALFLFAFFLFCDTVLFILLNALLDGFLGGLLLFTYGGFRRTLYNEP